MHRIASVVVVSTLLAMGLTACGDDQSRVVYDHGSPDMKAVPVPVEKTEPMKPYRDWAPGSKELPRVLKLDRIVEIPRVQYGRIAFAGPDRIGVAFNRTDFNLNPGTLFQVFDGHGNPVSAAGFLPEGNAGVSKLVGTPNGFAALVTEIDYRDFGRRPIITLDPNGRVIADIERQYSFTQDVVENGERFHAVEGVQFALDPNDENKTTVACRLLRFNEQGGEQVEITTVSTLGLSAFTRAGVTKNGVTVCGASIQRHGDRRELMLFMGDQKIVLAPERAARANESSWGVSTWVEKIFFTDTGLAVYWSDVPMLNGVGAFQSFLTMVSFKGTKEITYPLDGVMDLVQTEDGFAAVIRDAQQRLRIKLFDKQMLPVTDADIVLPTKAYFIGGNIATSGGRLAVQWQEGNINGWDLRLAILNQH